MHRCCRGHAHHAKASGVSCTELDMCNFNAVRMLRVSPRLQPKLPGASMQARATSVEVRLRLQAAAVQNAMLEMAPLQAGIDLGVLTSSEVSHMLLPTASCTAGVAEHHAHACMSRRTGVRMQISRGYRDHLLLLKWRLWSCRRRTGRRWLRSRQLPLLR